MSMVPQADHASAAQNKRDQTRRDGPADRRRRRLDDLQRRRQEGELVVRRRFAFRKGTTVCAGRGHGIALADFMDASLQAMQARRSGRRS